MGAERDTARGDAHPDPHLLNGISTDPNIGVPFVMWKGTPYARIMIVTSKRVK